MDCFKYYDLHSSIFCCFLLFKFVFFQPFPWNLCTGDKHFVFYFSLFSPAMRKNSHNNFYCKFIYIYSPITKCNCRAHTHAHIQHTTAGSIHNFYDGKWTIYLDFPCKFIVLFSLIFSLLLLPSTLMLFLLLLLPLFQFNSIFVGAIFIYLYLLFGLFIDRKSLISTYAYHTLHANVRTLYNNDVLRVLSAYITRWMRHTYTSYTFSVCIYYLAIAFLIIRLCKVFARMHHQMHRNAKRASE